MVGWQLILTKTLQIITDLHEHKDKYRPGVFALEGDLRLAHQDHKAHKQRRQQKPMGQHHIGGGGNIQAHPDHQKAEAPKNIAQGSAKDGLGSVAIHKKPSFLWGVFLYCTAERGECKGQLFP